MSKQIQYSDESIGKINLIPDFLPLPEVRIMLDKYEQKIKQDISQFSSVSQQKRLAIEALIDKANESEKISLQLAHDDFELLKQKAHLQGVSYQELISSLVHKFVSNQLVDKSALF